MNKYQEALNWLCNEAYGNCGHYEEQEEIIQKLIDKETPKKVVIEPQKIVKNYMCPRCDTIIESDFGLYDKGTKEYEEYKLDIHSTNRYCPRCGQKLDWSEE